jgi:hypothetical protein
MLAKGGDAMSEEKITVRMNLSSWNQITRDLGKFYAMDVEEAEVWESVEIERDDETWSSPAEDWKVGL